MTALSPDEARGLGGPDWLVNRRVAAAQSFAAQSLPSPGEEVWRYSPIDELDLSLYHLVTEGSSAGIPALVAEMLSTLPDRSATVVLRNGHPVLVETSAAAASRGVRIGPLADLGSADDLGVAFDEPADVFVELNDGFGSAPILVSVPDGVHLEAPVVVANWLDDEGALVAPRLVIRAGAASQFEVLDWSGSADVGALFVPVTEIEVGSSANVGYLDVQLLGERVWQLGTQDSKVHDQATLTASVAALGGDYARLRANCRLVGRGASGNLVSFYFGERSQTLDFRTFQDHVAPDCTSNLLFKGVVNDHSRSVYTGLIRVRPGASGTIAFQTNRNIQLSDDAWAQSVPNLEIENNDVKCSHASTVGPVDQDQVFYLESRGVPPIVAERLVVGGFFDEVISQLAVAAVADQMRAEVTRRLDAPALSGAGS
ncbi:MAG: Fe-S cluster assembly protein SufD [Actinomycetia bacterium]|nr:Fe-S cluster assembly protein SufD [Actinomycetes bacterium]